MIPNHYELIKEDNYDCSVARLHSELKIHQTSADVVWDYSIIPLINSWHKRNDTYTIHYFPFLPLLKQNW